MNRPAASWRRIGRGILCIGIGSFLLLNTTGRLSWSFWLSLVPLWPILLVSLGIRLMFERSRYTWGVVLAPLLVLGTMVWAAAGGTPMAGGRSVAVTAERPEGTERWLLDARMAYGYLVVGSAPPQGDTLLGGNARGVRGQPEVRTTLSGGRARVRLRQWGRSRIQLLSVGKRWARWSLDLARDIPVDLDLNLALTRADLDLDLVPVQSVFLKGAFNDIEMHLPRPPRPVTIVLDGSFSGYKLKVPQDVPVRVSTDGAFNITDRGWSGSVPGYRVRLEGAFNRLRLRSR